MLLVTSNWFISDGTVFGPPPLRQTEQFFADVQRMALRAGCRRDGSYRPVEQIDVVLAGDTFDWLSSREWLGSARPWGLGRGMADVMAGVMARSLQCGSRPLTRLARLARRGLTVPAADRRWRPIMGSGCIVPVRVTLLVGDRDAGLEEEAGRQMASRYGLAVGGHWTNGTVVIRHGEACDPLCGYPVCGPPVCGHLAASRWAGRADRPPTLHESLLVDLIAHFAEILAAGPLQHRLGSLRDVHRRLMRTLATAQPLDMPGWLALWLEPQSSEAQRRCTVRDAVNNPETAPAHKAWVTQAWQKAVDHWHRESRRVAPGSEAEFDSVEAVAEWMSDIHDRVGRCANGRLDAHQPTPEAVQLSGHSCDAPSGTVVLGHPPASLSRRSGGGQARCVCLGPRPLPRWSEVVPLARSTSIDAAWIPSAGSCVDLASQTVGQTVAFLDDAEWGDMDPLLCGAEFAPSESAAAVRLENGRIIDAA